MRIAASIPIAWEEPSAFFSQTGPWNACQTSSSGPISLCQLHVRQKFEMTSNSKQRPVSKKITVPVSLWLLWPLFGQVPSNTTTTSVSPATFFVSCLDWSKFSLTASMAAVCTFLAIEKDPQWCIGFESAMVEQNLDSCSCPMQTAGAATTAFTFTAKLSRELPLSYRWLARLLPFAVTRGDA